MQGIGRDVAVLFGAHRVPLAERDLPVVTAARHTGGARFLLPAVHPVGEAVVGGHVIELRGRLIVPGAPGLAAVDGDDRPLIAGDQDDARVARIDPHAMVVVAAGGAAERRERLAPVG